MDQVRRQAFHKTYGKIWDLAMIEVFVEAIASLTQYYDQLLKCFTFGDFQLVPTVEEFEGILGCPLRGRKPYLFFGFYPSMARVSKVVKISVIDAFLAYDHNKESPVIIVLVDAYDTFNLRCEKSSARIVFCTPALDVWLVSHFFRHESRLVCPLQGHRMCTEKGKANWEELLAGLPNVPLMGTMGCINYNPILAIRQLGYPMRGVPSEEIIAPFIAQDFSEGNAKMLQRVRKAWNAVERKDKKLKGSRNGVISGCHKWLKARTQGITWIPKLKISSGKEAEVPKESKEVQALKEKLERTRVVKEKFKMTATRVRKDNNELKLRRAERDESRVESLMLEHKLKACQRSKRSLTEQLSKTEENMLTIIDQYKKKLNLASSHEQRLEEEHAKVSSQQVEREARQRVIESLHGEAVKWMDRFTLTLNGSQELPKLLAKAKVMAGVYSASEEVHGLFEYCQHMIELMSHIIRNR
ncbi:hypothetical protein HKD37_19G053577 [Glycine soja]